MSSGVFTLPLIATDASVANSARRSHDGSQPFIAGDENSLLRVLIEAVFTEPPRYNPITLCGPSGLGKSHLLNGLVERLRTLSPHRKRIFLTGADFARQYARAVELDDLCEFRERLASTDVLVIDGLDELGTKTAAQEFLLHTISATIDRDSQVLCSSRSFSHEWTWMLPGLRSRLDGGLTVPLAPPSPATRIEIIRQIAANQGVSISNQTIEEIANDALAHSTLQPTYLQLQGSVHQLLAKSLAGSTNGSAVAKSKSSRKDDAVAANQIRKIAKLVARHFDLRLTDLTSASRRKTVVQARGVAIYLARTILGSSYDQIGKQLGGRDHTTIMHAFQKISKSFGEDAELERTVEKLASQIAGR